MAKLSSENRVYLNGNIGADPERRTFPSGEVYCTFSMATSKSWKDASGEWQTKSTWHDIRLLKNLAERALEFLKKGDEVIIEGELSNYDNAERGRKVFISASLFKKIERLKSSQSQQQNQNSWSSQQTPQQSPKLQSAWDQQSNHGYRAPQPVSAWNTQESQPPWSTPQPTANNNIIK